MKRFSASIDALDNPLKTGNPVTHEHNGKRLLMHSREIPPAPKKHAEKRRPEQIAITAQDNAPPLPSDLPRTLPKSMKPPRIVARNPSLAASEGWQLLAKAIVRAAGHPQRCHQSGCRRARVCIGGNDACYVREFAFVDVFMQRHVLPRLKAGARENADVED